MLTKHSTRTFSDDQFGYTVNIDATTERATITISFDVRPVTVTPDGETLAPEPLAHAEDLLGFAGELFEEVLDELDFDEAGNVWARQV